MDKNIILMAVTIFAMVFSGFYVMTYSERGAGTTEANVSQYIVEHQITPIGNRSMPVRVMEPTADVIVYMPELATIDAITDAANLSIENLIGFKYEVCKLGTSPSYQFFRFTFKDKESANETAVEKETGFAGKRRVLRGYTANASVLGGVYLIAAPGMKAGDYVDVAVFSKEDGILAIGGSRIQEDIIDAEVVNIEGILVSGEITGNSQNLAIANESEARVEKPAFVMDGLDNETAALIEGLDGVYAIKTQNSTRIEFEDSKSKIIEILESVNTSYSFEAGALTFMVPQNASTFELEERLRAENITDINFQKVGRVSVAKTVVVDNSIIRIEDNGNFSATLSMNATAGASVKVQINTLRFGDQIIPYMAQEV
ncbi:MAG: hypothetical protein MSIBF_02315 [Candidatus Altiarchaeales archaeon IMC4]|nr:MAG: hypothetical protein MSIBF_02315 [Candidatus Altiarchaeales archaeon IMC4]